MGGYTLAAKERLELIRQQVETEKKVTVANLSQLHKVTEETIRRDLEKLEAEGHTIIQKGRKNIEYFVKDYENALVDLGKLPSIP